MNDEGIYQVAERYTLAEAPGLRVRMLSLNAGQHVPWHYHNEITDTFFCMKGPMLVQTRDPSEVHVLHPGGTVSIPPGRAHYATGVDNQSCQFMVIQGVGTYDCVAVTN